MKRHFRYLVAALLLSAASIFCLAGCKGDTPLPPETLDRPIEETTLDTPVLLEPCVNPLTGLAVSEEKLQLRPYAIMLGNTKAASPQAGVADGDILFELPYEGGATRLMMLVQDISTVGEIGSIRSARDYAVRLSQDFDAIFVHAGGDSDGINLTYNSIKYGFEVSEKIKSVALSDPKYTKGPLGKYPELWADSYPELIGERVDNIDFINGHYRMIEQFSYRSTERINTMGREHSLMSSGELLSEAAKWHEYRTSLKDDFSLPFEFVSIGEEKLSGNKAQSVKIYYSGFMQPEFEYDSESESYVRSQFGKAHTDDKGVQLSFTNLIILFFDTFEFEGDAKDRLCVEYVGSGEGYFVSRGGYEKIRWERTGATEQLRLLTESGETLAVNRGKSYIAVVPAAFSDKTIIE